MARYLDMWTPLPYLNLERLDYQSLAKNRMAGPNPGTCSHCPNSMSDVNSLPGYRRSVPKHLLLHPITRKGDQKVTKSGGFTKKRPCIVPDYQLLTRSFLGPQAISSRTRLSRTWTNFGSCGNGYRILKAQNNSISHPFLKCCWAQ